ncbi:cation diffusion facilitator family transporter [Candidatus Formimonas warabiya]|uniref:Cation-efflux pump n=1 Tax=Formimonas warabiya TaxID=1761012 RepID=A0A3G1KWA2_FORW1|nr:cation diffusion facilitator family transporter [Candidatus Formimonas warabiya]ATW26485.1 cation-efflux pump [Candidatus Formimonas warabiya]
MDARVKAAQVSVMSNSLLVVLKLFVGLWMGSVSVISEAIHSGLDLVAALIAFLSLRQASQPADDQHQFGHGKIENVSGVLEAILIFIAAIWIMVEAVKKLMSGAHLESVGLGILVMGIAALINFFVARYLFSVAKATDSIALKADALHLSTDVFTSLGVMAGLGLIKLTGIQVLDPLAAMIVGCLIIKASFALTKEALLPLIDTKLPEAEEKEIIDIIRGYQQDFVEFHKLRSRKAGSERHIDLHLVVPRDKHVREVHAMCDQIELEIKHRFASSHVLIHIEPCESDCDACKTTCTENEK